MMRKPYTSAADFDSRNPMSSAALEPAPCFSRSNAATRKFRHKKSRSEERLELSLKQSRSQGAYVTVRTPAMPVIVIVTPWVKFVG